MSVTCGFYNAIDHDRRYNAKQMSSIFDGIINDGVFMNIGMALAVKAYSEADPDATLNNMNVYVHPGRCWFNSTWTLNDAIEPVKVDLSELVLDRIDALVIEINGEDAVRENSFKIIKGTPGTEPVKPEMVDTEYVHQHPLAYIRVRAGVTKILQEDITNCIGTDDCPFITGVLQTIDADILIAQWMDQFSNWFSGVQRKVNRFLKIIPGTLKAGATEVVFEDAFIDENTIFSFYSERFDMSPIDVAVDAENHTITLTYEPQTNDILVGVSIDG